MEIANMLSTLLAVLALFSVAYADAVSSATIDR